MATLLRVPEVVAGAHEVIIAEWLVDEDASFTVGQPIAAVETDKAVVDVEADTDAVLLQRLAPSGATVEVGAPMALIGDGSEQHSDLEQLLGELGVGSPGVVSGQAAAPEPAAAAAGPADGAPDRSVDPGTPKTDTAPGDRRVFITPIARRVLAEAGLGPEGVEGTGPGGRILRRDAEKAAAQARADDQATTLRTPPAESSGTDSAREAAREAAHPTPTPTPAVDPTAPSFEEIPHSRLRRAMAARLTASKQSAPHFYLRRTVRIDALLALRTELNEVAPHKISVNDLVLRAVATAHVQVPEANVIWTDTGLRKFASVDVAVAIASNRGLVTPVLRDVQNASVGTVAARVRAYVAQADEGKLQQRDLEGGSITVSNLGMYGVDEFAAIINPPHSAILAVGAGRPAPVVTGTAVEVGTLMSLVLSVDHRAIDGALAAQWMAALVAGIEQPLRLLA